MIETKTDEKTWTLKVTYMGESMENPDLTREDLETSSVFSDTEEGLGKWSGNGFQDFEANPLRWRDGTATETGILTEGLTCTGTNKENFDFCNEWLAKGGEEPLVMLDEDGQITEDESEADWATTLDSYNDHSPNHQKLTALNYAEWELIEEA